LTPLAARLCLTRYGKKHHDPLTLADLKEALRGFATQEDLKALAPQETVNAIMETVAETKEGMTGLEDS
jgi:hypothetical protein